MNLLFRFYCLVALLFIPIVGSANAASKLSSAAQAKSKYVPMVFFVAKGGPNSCGPGCNTWIAAEGDFDGEAATRFRAFLDRVGSNLPIYFQSRGGLLGPALLIGDTLHARRMTASVGRTLPADCRGKTKAVCDSIKSSGLEVRSLLETDASCASACVYAVIGGARRKIAPNALLRVHAPRDLGKSSAERRAQFMSVVDRYMTRSGVGPELMKLTLSVPFERVRTLTQREIVQFGIARDEPHAAWNVEMMGATRAATIKFFRTAWSGEGTIDLDVRMYCATGGAVEVSYYSRGPLQRTPNDDVLLTIGGQMIRLKSLPGIPLGSEMRLGIVPPEALDKLAASGNIALSRDGAPQSGFAVSTAGFAAAVDNALQPCKVGGHPPKASTYRGAFTPRHRA